MLVDGITAAAWYVYCVATVIVYDAVDAV